MLRYTGHPLLDVGIAAIVAFARKNAPDEIVEVDLEEIADYMAANYSKHPLRGFLTVAFPNSGFTQPAYFKAPEKQQAYGEAVLRAFRPETPTTDETGIFLGLPTAAVSFDVDGKLSAGRAYRQHIPLLSGVTPINFFPEGDAGLPVSGLALLALQAYPLGSAKCAGRTLSVHSDSAEIMQHFAHTFWEQNRRTIQVAQQSNNKKLAEPHLKYRTLVMQTLLDARQMQIDDEQPFSITIYHLTNSGQGADLAIYHLPSPMIIYLKEMVSAEYKTAWQRVVRQGWERAKLKKGETTPPDDFRPRVNWLYEDMFRLGSDVSQAPRFIRTYFLRRPLKFAKRDKTDPRGGYSTSQQINLVSWKLLEPFLRRIIYMDTERIRHIRELGDALAGYIAEENDKRFFQRFYMENKYGNLRVELLKVTRRAVQQGGEPLVTLERYLGVFEEGEELARVNWRLARDLVLIRLIEQLHSKGWFATHQDVLPDIEEENQTE